MELTTRSPILTRSGIAATDTAVSTGAPIGTMPGVWPPPPAGMPPVSPPARRPRGGRRVLAMVALVGIAGGAGFVGGRLGDGGGSTSATAARTTSVVFDGTTLDVASVLARVEASVVSIDTVVQVGRGPFRGEGTGAGTGVVLDAAGGYVLTNAHVVDGATSITVTVGDGSPRTATVVAADTTNDIAVVHLGDTSGLVAAPVGSSDALAVGDQVIAIGNALALEGGLSVTEGIVSALDRSACRSRADRRGDQLGQLGRRLGERRRRGRGHQHRSGHQQRHRVGVEHRLRDPDRHRGRGGSAPDRQLSGMVVGHPPGDLLTAPPGTGHEHDERDGAHDPHRQQQPGHRCERPPHATPLE